ncbi:MAG: glycosyltransferase family 2 protein [Lacisediminihabitans sp.]
MPSVSVALCTHNGARYIEEQLRSILGQTVLPLEVVVSDDASTDGTLELVRHLWTELTGSAPRLVLLHNEIALGVTANFEQAISACTGDLISLSDQDDVWAPGRLEALIAKFENRPQLSLVFSDARLVSSAGDALGASLFEALEISSADLDALRTGDAFATLLRRNLVTGATAAFRRTLLENAAPFEMAWVHDEWLAIIAAATSEVDWMPEQLIDYRQHGQNQIGVSVPTLRYKIGRVFEPRGDRNERLALRATALLSRLEMLEVRPQIRELARGKAAHELFRAGLQRNRASRVVPILREALTGNYGRFSSRGRWDIVRDMMQSARR